MNPRTKILARGEKIKTACLAALNGSRPFSQMTIYDLGAQIIYGAQRTTYHYGNQTFSEPVARASEAKKIHDALLAMPTIQKLKASNPHV